MKNETPNLENKLPFSSELFKNAWHEWLEYRKERKLPKYVPRGLKMTFTRLVNMSDSNESVAISMIEYSISQNFQGIFKENKNGTTTFKDSGKPGTSEARINALKNW